MEIVITKTTENPLLERIELQGQVTFEGSTPSKVQVMEGIAKMLKKEPELVVLQHVYTHFSVQKADFTARLYATPEAKKKIEVVPSHVKKKLNEEKKKAAEAKKEGEK